MSKIIEVEHHLINLSSITYVEEKGTGIIIHFVGAQPALELAITYTNFRLQVLSGT